MIKGPGLTADGEWIKRNTFPDYWTETLWLAIDLWTKWKKHGLPFGPNWAEHPAWMLDCIDTIDDVVASHDDKRGNDGRNR